MAPLLAAFAVLFGVVVTLTVTERRNNRQSKLTREDEYRADVRKAIGEMLVNAEEFRRHGWALSRPEDWVKLGFEQSTNFRDTAESALRATNTALINAQLLAQDKVLIDELSAFKNCLDNACDVMLDMLDAYWESRPPVLKNQREDAWMYFEKACGRLHGISRDSLLPTVRQHRQKSQIEA